MASSDRLRTVGQFSEKILTRSEMKQNKNPLYQLFIRSIRVTKTNLMQQRFIISFALILLK